MSVHIPVEDLLGHRHRAALDDVNRWRGHCVECFARLEEEIASTLLMMATINQSKVTVPHNFGEKVKKLRAAVDEHGPFANIKLAKALDDFAAHIDRRNMLVHATGRVWIDANGDWLWRYRFQPSGKAKPLESGCFENKRASEFERSLARGVQSLGGKLRALRQELEAVTE